MNASTYSLFHPDTGAVDHNEYTWRGGMVLVYLMLCTGIVEAEVHWMSYFEVIQFTTSVNPLPVPSLSP